MQFLAPLFWIAAVAVGVPIWIHLTRREVSRPMPFASLMFLKRIPVHEFRKRRVQNWLLLLLRALLVLALVAAFTRPAINPFLISGVSSQSVLILLDDSLSMSRQDVWDRAQEAVRETVRALKPGDEAGMIRFGSSSRVAEPWTDDPNRILAALERDADTSFESTSFREGISASISQLTKARSGLASIVVISDLQASGVDFSRSDLRLPAGVEVKVLDVGEPDVNFFLEPVKLLLETFEEVYPFPLVVRVARSGNPDEEVSAVVSLELEGAPVDRKPFTLGKGEETVAVSFAPFSIAEGTSRGRLKLDLEDALPEDNELHFVLRRSSPQALLVWTSPGSSQDALFFREAVTSGKNLPFRVFEETGRPGLQREDLRVVVAANLSGLPNPNELREFVERGGGLVITLGNQVQPGEYTTQRSAFLPAEPVERVYGRGGGSDFVTITDFEREHPVFEPFLEATGNPFASVQFFGYWKLRPREGSRVLARFSTGDPALVEYPLGEGRVILFASSLDRDWTDFPVRTTFLPFWQQTVGYCSQWRPVSAYEFVESTLDIAARIGPQEVSSGRWDVLDPRGRRLVPLADEKIQQVRLERPGYYELRWEKKTDWIAANVPRAESNLSKLEAGELESAINSLRSTQPVSQNPSAGEAPNYEAWWILVLLAVALLAGETVAANRNRWFGGRTSTASIAR